MKKDQSDSQWAKINTYAEALRQVSNQNNLIFGDLHTAIEDAMEHLDPTQLLRDRVRPHNAGQVIITLAQLLRLDHHSLFGSSMRFELF